jgi:hypothetical protein
MKEHLGHIQEDGVLATEAWGGGSRCFPFASVCSSAHSDALPGG